MEQGGSIGNTKSHPRVNHVPFADLLQTGRKQGPSEIM